MRYLVVSYKGPYSTYSCGYLNQEFPEEMQIKSCSDLKEAAEIISWFDTKRDEDDGSPCYHKVFDCEKGFPDVSFNSMTDDFQNDIPAECQEYLDTEKQRALARKEEEARQARLRREEAAAAKRLQQEQENERKERALFNQLKEKYEGVKQS